MADSRQGDGIIQLGTPGNPTLYTARVLSGPSGWQRIAIAFVATDPTVRIGLLGQADGPGNTVEYDGIRFLPPGRNPVLLMAAIFARFLPHLTLDGASVAAAADRRNEWLFSGYIPDPGRTDQLLTKMSQECFCTVFKDLDGVHKITADDPDHLPVLHLDHRQDIFEQTLEVQGLPMDQVYTDFYLWYQRVSTQVTTSQAGQYAAVLYVTPDDSISQYPELQTLCAQAAFALSTRTRFDFYSDFIADPATADLLLSRLVRQLSIIRREVSLQAALPAVPLSLTDHVAVHAPLLGQKPFVGEMRRAELAFTAQAPGLALGLTLRESGLVRGAWETWDVVALGSGGPASPGDAVALRALVSPRNLGDPGSPTSPAAVSWPPGAIRVQEGWPGSPPAVGCQRLLDEPGLSVGLLACWDLDESSGDRIDHVSGLVLHPYAPIPAVPGHIGNAAAFAHVPEHVLDGGDLFTDMEMHDFTMALWVRLRSVPDVPSGGDPGLFYTLIANGESSGYGDFHFWLCVGTDAAQGQVFLQVTYYPYEFAYAAFSTRALVVGEWTLVTAWQTVEPGLVVGIGGGLYHRTHMAIQFNQEAIATADGYVYSEPVPRVPHFTLGAIGGFAVAGTAPLDGDLNTVMIWNRVLSAAERAVIWNGGAG